MTNKEIAFAIGNAIEAKEKGFHKCANRYFKTATNAISSDKFNRHSVQGKLIMEYWQRAFDKIV